MDTILEKEIGDLFEIIRYICVRGEATNRELRINTSISLSKGQLYLRLKRLEQEGELVSVLKPNMQCVVGRYYRLTETSRAEWEASCLSHSLYA